MVLKFSLKTIQKTTNDAELGKKLREEVYALLDLVNDSPNDDTLGEEVRDIYNKHIALEQIFK
mgnify:CR=1 FL=1|jgi:hypothetical protein|tara:strand:+ start:9498 stop:9686 length:189 start_codon:yes stop_codon:yes gene_type:complete